MSSSEVAVYTSEQALQRLGFLQQLCAKRLDGNEVIDGILLITGIDSQYNAGAAKVVQYLFQGTCGFDTATISETLEDLVVVITRWSIRIYCRRPAYDSLKRFLDSFRNCHVYCPPDSFADDADVDEEYKIRSFVEMVDGIKRLGVAMDANLDPFDLEKWPIVQAYGLEGFGPGGFFTMRHQIVGLLGSIEEVINEADCHTLDVLAHRDFSLLRSHWTSITDVFDNSTPSRRLQLTEKEISEPLQSYYDFGNLRQPAGSRMNGEGVDLRPRVKCGTQTRGMCLEDPTDITVAQAGLPESKGAGGGALHYVAEAVQARGPLYFARSYLLTNCHVPVDNVEDEEKVVEGATGADSSAGAKTELHWSNSDSSLLAKLYAMLVSTSLKVVESFEREVIPNPKVIAETAMMKAKDDFLIPPEYDLRSKLAVDLYEVDIHGHRRGVWEHSHLDNLSVDELADLFHGRLTLEPLAGTAAPCYTRDGSARLFTLRCVLQDVPSCEHRGKSLGSLVFGETFALSCSHNVAHRQSMAQLLTWRIPYLVTWTAAGREHVASERVSKKLRSLMSPASRGAAPLGKVLGRAVERVHLLGGTPLMSLLCGSGQFFHGGFYFSHPRQGPLTVALESDIESMALYDAGEDDEVGAVLLITYRESFLPYGLLPLLRPHRQIALHLPPPARRIFRREVMGTWTSAGHHFQEVEDVSALPSPFADGMAAVLTTAHTMSDASGPGGIGVHSEAQFRLHSSWMRAWGGLPPVERIPILKSALKSLEPRSSADKQVDSDGSCGMEAEGVPVIVVCGPAGSGKRSVAASLLRLTSHSANWHCVDIPLEGGIDFPAALVASRLLDVRRALATQSSDQRVPRVMLVLPSSCDVISAARTVEHVSASASPGPALAIHHVIACISTRAVNVALGQVAYGLSTCVGKGWATAAVLTGTDGKGEATAREFLRRINPEILVVKARQYSVVDDSDLSALTRTPPAEDSLAPAPAGTDPAGVPAFSAAAAGLFGDPPKVLARDISTPGWWEQGTHPPQLPLQCVSFKVQPHLHRRRTQRQLEMLLSKHRVPPTQANGRTAKVSSEPRTAPHGVTMMYLEPTGMRILQVKGDVVFQDAPNVAQCLGNSGKHVSIYAAPDFSTAAVGRLSRDGEGEETPPCVIQFIGMDLDAEELRMVLHACLPDIPVRKRLRGPVDVTDVEKTALHKKHLAAPLPAGYFFNGSHYVDMEGNLLQYHPDMDKFVEQYLEETNKSIEEDNAAVESNTIEYLVTQCSP